MLRWSGLSGLVDWSVPATWPHQARVHVSAARDPQITALTRARWSRTRRLWQQTGRWHAAMRRPETGLKGAQRMASVAHACRSAGVLPQLRELEIAARGARAGAEDQPGSCRASILFEPLGSALRGACRQWMPPERAAGSGPWTDAGSEEPARCELDIDCELGVDRYF